MIKDLQQKSALDEEVIERWEKEKAKLVESANLYKAELDGCMEKLASLRKAHN
jgi:hypothetical protein